MPSDIFDSMLQDLEAITESSDSTTSNKINIVKLFASAVTSAYNVLDSIAGGGDRISDAKDLYDKVTKIDYERDEYYMELNSNINRPLLDHYSLNVTNIFKGTVADILKDIPKSNESSSFSAESVINDNFAKALKQCGMYSSGITPSNFNESYKKLVFGPKKMMFPEPDKIMINIRKCNSVISYIQTDIISGYISSIRSERNKIFAKISKISSADRFHEYSSALNKAFDITEKIYKDMITIYRSYREYCQSVLEKIIKKNKELQNNNESVNNLVIDIFNVISPINKALNESASSSLNESAEEPSESLTDKFHAIIDPCMKNIESTTKQYLIDVGPALLSIDTSKDYTNKQITLYQGALSPIENILDNISDKLSKNIDLLTNFSEQYNDMNINRLDVVKSLMPDSIAECIPDNLDMNILITNLRNTICGNRVTMVPDIGILTQNAISIPGFLGGIGSHIHIVISLIDKSIEKLQTIPAGDSGKLMAIKNIKSTLITYIAIILSITKILSILERSVLDSVTAISEL